MRSRWFAKGFTLIELMVVVAIIAIVASIGLPSMSSLIASQRIKSTAASLQGTLNLTRAEALKRNSNVILAPNAGTDWATGWKVYDPNSATVTLFTSEAVSSIVITGPASVTYQRSGRVQTGTNGTFKLSSSQTSDIRCVTIDPSGQAVVATSGC